MTSPENIPFLDSFFFDPEFYFPLSGIIATYLNFGRPGLLPGIGRLLLTPSPPEAFEAGIFGLFVFSPIGTIVLDTSSSSSPFFCHSETISFRLAGGGIICGFSC